MSLKPADIDNIIQLLTQITEALSKTDFLSPKEQEQLNKYNQYELQRKCKMDKAKLSMANRGSGSYRFDEKEDERCRKEISYDKDVSATLKNKLLKAKQEYIESNIKPLQKKLDLCLSPRLSQIEYSDEEALKKFAETLDKIGAILETPLYPFKAGKLQYINLTGKPDHVKYGAYRFSNEDEDLIESTVGFPLNISKLRAYLATECNVQNPDNYSWPDILAALKHKIEKESANTKKGQVETNIQVDIDSDLKFPRVKTLLTLGKLANEVKEWGNKLITYKLDPWIFFRSNGVNITKYDGKSININGKFSGTNVLVFWEGFIEQFLKKGIDEWLEHIAELCLQRKKDPNQYLPTVKINLESVIQNVYWTMASIDFRLRKAAVCCIASENFGKNIQRKDISNETSRMIDYLNGRYKEVLNTAEADYAKLSASGKAKETKTRTVKSKKPLSKNAEIEYSFPLPLTKWASIFGISENTLRKLRDKKKYHFDQISKRKWRLPKHEIPTEYLEKYRQAAR